MVHVNCGPSSILLDLEEKGKEGKSASTVIHLYRNVPRKYKVLYAVTTSPMERVPLELWEDSLKKLVEKVDMMPYLVLNTVLGLQQILLEK